MTEERVREIVREEIRAALKVLEDRADRYPGYETDTLEDAAARVLSSVAESTESLLRHAPECVTRTESSVWSTCSCGVD